MTPAAGTLGTLSAHFPPLQGVGIQGFDRWWRMLVVAFCGDAETPAGSSVGR